MAARDNAKSFYLIGVTMTFEEKHRVKMIEDSTLLQILKTPEPVAEKGHKMFFVAGIGIGLTICALIILLWEFKRD